jgi:hypothetical protein
MVSEEIKPYLNEIAERLWSGHAAVMVGAGFSKNSHESFPNWNQLGNIFYKKIHNKEPEDDKHYLNILKLAHEVEATFGRPALNQLLRISIPDEEYEPSSLHVKLLELPWNDVFTTNYDTLLERACSNVDSQKFDIVTKKRDLVYSEKPRIIKLHGSFPSGPFIITEEDYRKYPKEFAPFVNTVQQSLLENTLCLIGFSGDDPNFFKWIGWILDNLGKENSPKIFLIGILERLSYAQKRLLEEQRNIRLVDMSNYPNVNKDHAKALKELFKYLQSKKKDNRLGWPATYRHLYTDSTKEAIPQLKEIIREWRNQRETYPNWIILPTDRRSTLWTYTEGWFHISPQCKKLETPLDIEFIYELNWRIEKCLCPIFNDNIEIFKSVIEKYNPFPDKCNIETALVVRNDEAYKNLDWEKIKAAWLELHISMMRFYREGGLHKEWEILNNRIQQLYSALSPEMIARVHYDRCLYALFSLNIANVRDQIRLWPIDESLPFWENKRAGLFAELGEIDSAEKILETSLTNIRKQLNLSPVSNNYSLVSRESYVMLLLQSVKDAIFFNRKRDARKYSDEDIEDEDIKEEYLAEFSESSKQQTEDRLNVDDIRLTKRKGHEDFESTWNELLNNRFKKGYKEKWKNLEDKVRIRKREYIRQKFSDRWNSLKQYKCDPWNELKLFAGCLNREPTYSPITYKKHEFDIGRFSVTHHFGGTNEEVLTAYSFLRFCEELGISYRIPGLNICTESAKGAIERISDYSPYWAFAALVRTADSKATARIFDRISIYNKSVEQIDRLIGEYLQVLKSVQDEIERGDRFKRDNFGIVLATVIPEILSRLCTKCSTNSKDSLLSLVKEIYSSNQKHKYEGISNLVRRLLNSYSEAEKYSRLPVLLEFPIPNDLNLITTNEYPEPFYFLAMNQRHVATSKDIQLDQTTISRLLQVASSEDREERTRAIHRIAELYKLNLLNEEQINKFSEVLWSQTDDLTGFPKNTDYYNFAFLESLPHPSDVDPASLFKDYITKERFPIQKTEIDKGIPITNGDIRLCRELTGATRMPLSEKGIDWSEQESTDLLHRLLEWWDSDKEFTKKDMDTEFLSISDEFKKRFDNLTRILNQVIIPRLSVEVSIREELGRLLKELSEYGIRCLATRAVALCVFPEQRHDIFNEIELAISSKEQEEVKDGYNAIYQLLLLHNTNKIEEIPSDMFSYVGLPIKWRYPTTLIHAMRFGIRFLNEFSEEITDELTRDMLFGLESLLKETSFENHLSSTEIVQRLDTRALAVSLAYNLHNYYLNKGLPIPETLEKWRSISEDLEEFADIRNKWNQ